MPKQDAYGQPFASLDLGPGDGLRGMPRIEAYSGYSEKVVRRIVVEMDFPAWQIVDATWESSKSMIDEWRRQQITLAMTRREAA
jgi:hypothetical protein